MEQQIRNRAMKDAESLSKEQKKHISLYKEWRKGLTGVLIDLHWLRILGANSKILAMNTQMLGKAFGYLIDMALLPLVPAMVQFTKYIIGVAKWMRQLPQPARLLVAGLAALAIGVTTLGTILMYATSALTAFSAAVTAATAAETAKTGQTTLGMFGAGGAAVGGAAFGAAGVAGVGAGLGLGILNEKLLGTGPKAAWNRYALISKLFGKDIPLMQEGGIATKPTLGIFGEGGAEAIIPLSKIGEVMGGILGAGASFANTLTQAATGGGGVGGGLNMGGGTGGSGGLLAKGFTWVAMAINQGFKVANELLAALLTLVAQGGGGLGGTPKSIWDFIIVTVKSVWEFIKTTIKSIWEFITGVAKSIWEWIVESAKSVWEWIETVAKSIWEWITVTVKSIWEFLSTPTKVVWEFLLTPVKSIWDFITTDGKPTGKPTPEGGGTPTGSKAPIFEGLQKVFENGVYIGDWELYSDGSKKWRPNPNTQYAGTTAPPSGTDSKSRGEGDPTSVFYDEVVDTTQKAADDYAKTVNDALNSGAKTVSEGTTESTTSFTEVFAGAMTAVGKVVWDATMGVVTTVADGVNTAINAAGTVLGVVNDWLGTTPGGRAPTTSTAITGGFTAQNALGAIGAIGGGATASNIVSKVVEGAVADVGGGLAHALGIPGFQSGGVMPHTGLAFLHEGETVIPSGGGNNIAGGITINNPTFVISGRTDRELFENFMRMMKSEGARVH